MRVALVSSVALMLLACSTLDAPQEQVPPHQASNASTTAFVPLTPDEIRSIAEQFSGCWEVNSNLASSQDAVQLRVQLDRQGNVRNVVPGEGGVPTDPRGRALYESARRALLSPRCNPLRVPPEKHLTPDFPDDLDLAGPNRRNSGIVSIG
jgi:hypothetical protein